jgi:hypothetical protein
MSFGARFLANPDLFPARRSGEGWGERVVALDLPGGPYRFAGLNEAQVEAVRARFGAHCRDDEGPATVEGLLLRAPETDFLSFPVAGWEYALDFHYGADAVLLAGLRLMGRLDWRPRLCAALWTPDAGGPAFAGIFENLLRVLVAYRLFESGGAVVHGAALLGPGGGHLFLGRSGAGKSTLSRLAAEQGAVVLSDDLNALLPHDAGIRLAKLPFTGDWGDSRSAEAPVPLAALHRLEKSHEDALTPLPRSAAVALLAACSPYLNADPGRRDRLLAQAERLLPPGLPTWTLCFSLTGGFWPILAAACSRSS